MTAAVAGCANHMDFNYLQVCGMFFFGFFVVETLASSSAAVAVTSPSPTAPLMFV
jgi:hypothetical protein